MNRWRNVLLLVVLLTCAASFWWARREPVATSAPAAGAVHAPTAGPPAALRPTVAVAVLNGTNVSGLARRVSRQLPRHGCVVVSVADAPHDSFARTLLINRRLDPERAEDLAAALADPPVLTEWDPRCDEDAVLVLGWDHERVLQRLAGDPPSDRRLRK